MTPTPRRSSSRAGRTLLAALAVAAVGAGCAKSSPSGTGVTPVGPDAAPNAVPIAAKVPEPSAKPAGPKPQRFGEFANSVSNLVSTDGEAGAFALITSADREQKGDTVHVCQTATGKRLGTLHLGEGAAGLHTYAVQSDGRRLAMMTSRGRLNLYAVADGAEVGGFPLEVTGEPASSVSVIAMAFVSPDRLLTASVAGGFDVHDTVSGKRLFGVTGALEPLPQLRKVRDASTFALAEVSKLVAVFDGDGFSFYDSATGKPTGKTDRLDLAGPFEVWGTALRPDGTRLAAGLRKGDIKTGADVIKVWDTATGKLLAESGLAVGDPFRSRLEWCGSDFLAVQGVGGNVEVWSAADTLAKQATVRTSYTAWVVGGKLCQAVVSGAYPKKSHGLLRCAPPTADLGPNVWLYPDGYTNRPKSE